MPVPALVPVHPLVVHLVAVLVPLTAIGAVLGALWPRFSRRFAVLVAILAWVSVGAAFAAEVSGEDLTMSEGVPAAHVEAASGLPALATGLALLVTAFWLFDRGVPGNRPRPWWLKVLAVAVILAAVLAALWAVRSAVTGTQVSWS